MFQFIIWSEDDDPNGNVAHILENSVTMDEVEEVLCSSSSMAGVSKSSGRPMVSGRTVCGRRLIVVYEVVEDDPRTIYHITAYEPKRRSE